MNNVIISKALGNYIRYQIMLLLVHCEASCCPVDSEINHLPGLCNCELMAELGIIQSRVSYHMKELTGAGLVNEVTWGKWKYYHINKKILREYAEQLNQDLVLK